MTAQEFAQVVTQVRREKAHEFATPNRWNDHESRHLPHDLPPAPAPDGVDQVRYEGLVF